MISCEICEIFKNTFFYRTPQVAASDHPYIPHETIICDDQDPPWINNKGKKAILEKNQRFSRVKSNIDNGTLLKKLQCLQNKLNGLINTAKGQYCTRISILYNDGPND